MSGPDDDAGALIERLLAPEVIADPYPVLARLRELGRMHATGGVLFATRYEDCATVTRETALFRAQSPQWCDRVTPGWRERPSKVATFEAMLFQDPPDHTRLRRLVSAAFTPRQAERMRSQVARLVDGALDALAEAGSGGSPVDLHATLAATLPIAVIGSLVGVPPSDWAGLQTWMSALLQVVEFAVTKQQIADADRAALELRGYFATLVASRRAHPRDDLASALVSVRDAAVGCGSGKRSATLDATAPDATAPDAAAGLTEDELLQTLTFLFMAGVDTMTNLLANGAAAFMAHPDQAALLRADPGLTSGAVDEVLRFDPPVQIVGRVAAGQTAVGGTTVPAGGLVIALLGSANRDPARFPRPDTFDITRTGSTVLSFGGGIHYCLGAPLARVEAGTFLAALVTRFPGLQLAGTPIRQGMVFRGFSKLPVTVS